MLSHRLIGALLALALALSPAAAQRPRQRVVPVAAPVVLPGYADYARLALTAPIVADALVRSTQRLAPKDAPDLAAGLARFYVTADVGTLIRGPYGLPPRVSYVVDVALDARGKPPGFRKLRVLLFARALAARPGVVQLVAPDGQRPWTPGADARVRGILNEAVALDAPPVVTGVGNAFHVPGTLPGEGETQIFLTTAAGQPVSISVVRRPGERITWSVALSEIVAQASPPPRRDTLLWYRLACALPPALPRDSGGDAVAAEDYRFVIDSLGPCDA